MKKQLISISIVLASASALMFTSCSKDPEKTTTPTPIVGSSGFYVLNEGGFGKKNASVSYYDKSSKSIVKDIYKNANGKDLGDQAQSMYIYQDKAYIVVQNSYKVEVVSVSGFKSTTPSVLDLGSSTASPRYFIAINDKTGYLTDWESNSVLVIDLATSKKTSSIAVGTGPDELVKIGKYVYVLNGGGYGSDNKVSVINTENNTLAQTINTGDAPNTLAVDKDNNLWVLCGGKYKADFSGLETKGKLVKINTAANAVAQTLEFGSASDRPGNLIINGTSDMMYYEYRGKIFAQGIAATALDTAAHVLKRSFYALAYDPSDNYIIGCDAGDFKGDGKIVRYKIESSKVVSTVDSMVVGVIPNGVILK
ncbi:MAG: YncE family protein [Cytophagales bacterium]|nr:YncE family protein [Cytophagales bacterium]